MSRILLLVTGLLASAGQVYAQDRLRLSVRDPGGQVRRATGWLAEADADSIVLVNGGYRAAFARHAITRVERSLGLKVSSSALTGALVAGGYATVLGAAMTTACHPDGRVEVLCGASAGDVVKITIFAAVTGATIGALIGTFAGEQWQVESLNQIPLRGAMGRSGGAVSVNLRF